MENLPIFIKEAKKLELKIQVIATHATHAVHRRRSMDTDEPGFGIDFEMPEKMLRLYRRVSVMSPPMDADRYLKEDFDAILSFIGQELPDDEQLVCPGN